MNYFNFFTCFFIALAFSLSTYVLSRSLSSGKFSPHTAPPMSLAAEEVTMSDNELMWRAPLATKGVAKVAFLFLVKRSLPLAPLWEHFFKGHPGFYSIYVHSDPSSFSEIDNGVFRGRRIPSQEVRWGKFSMVEAELRLLASALLDDPWNQRFVLLSETCIPLFKFSTVYSYLVNSSSLSHVESYDLVGHAGRGRYKWTLGPMVSLQQWRKGSQWFELDRDIAAQVILDQSYFSTFDRSCSNSACYADEHYFPTWVNMNESVARRNTNRSLTWVDWSKGGAHPARFGQMQVTAEFLERLRGDGKTCEHDGKETNICFLFARKFLPDALDVLLQFAREKLTD